MISQDRDYFAGVLVGIARSETTETVDSVAARLLTRAGWSERYSHRHLVRRVLSALLAELETTPTMDRARTLVDEMAADYENYTTVQVVSFPVVNLRVPAEGLQISDISLRMLDEETIVELEGQLRAVLAGSRNDEAT